MAVSQASPGAAFSTPAFSHSLFPEGRFFLCQTGAEHAVQRAAQMTQVFPKSENQLNNTSSTSHVTRIDQNSVFLSFRHHLDMILK